MFVTSIERCVVVRIIIILLITLYGVTECRRVKRVIGGEEVSCGSQISIASLRNSTSDQHLCGATLLSRYFAVTAAHCVQREARNYLLHLNNYCLDDNQIPPQIKVLEVVRHPDYDEYSRKHDIALLRIHNNLQCTWLNEAMLPTSSFGLSGVCSVYGYGYKDVNSEEVSERLLVAKLELISLDECGRRLGPHLSPEHDHGMLCAVGDGADTCQGDSGGPLICGGKLEGVCSYGLSCGVPDVPGVYTSIAPNLKWLSDILNSYNCQ